MEAYHHGKLKAISNKHRFHDEKLNNLYFRRNLTKVIKEDKKNSR